MFDLKAAGFNDPVLVAANDGVGTKLKIAIEAGKHDTVGIDLVAMCVNDLIVQGAEPLFFLDYFATGRLEVDVAAAVVEGIAEGCRQAGCALIGGETAEMPGMYSAGDYDLAGFAVGAAERGNLLPASDLADGDFLVGIASSGVHSNGYSLVRKLVTQSGLAWNDQLPFAQGQTMADALLEPTKIYARPLLAAIRDTGSIKAMAHITGGGFTENIPRVLPETLAAEIDLSDIDLPPVFTWLQQAGNISDSEMLKTFNCGIGMVCVAEEATLEPLIELLTASGENAIVIGRVCKRSGDPVTYRGSLATGVA